MNLHFETSDGPIDFEVKRLVVAGWTARDEAAVQHHIDELAAIGVAPPNQVPLYYQASRTQVIQSENIEVLGSGTSGEVEPILIKHEGTIWLGLGSDHTDRDLEAYSVAHSKQICIKPVARQLWKYDEVADHIENIELSAEIHESGEWVAYQEGTISLIRPLLDLAEGAGFDDGCLLFCGTFAAIGGVRPAARFRMKMRDPVLDREIVAAYQANYLDIIN